MNYLLDTHTHTLASGHAYGTISEMAKAASEKGLEFLGITDHAPTMPGSCHEFYFHNLKVVDRELFGVELALGVELNVIDYDGNVDLPEWVLKSMDITIASFHAPCLTPGTIEQNTQAMIKAIQNPLINIIGHPDDGRFPLDYERVVKAAKQNHTLLELNNSSLTPGGFRLGTEANDTIMLQYCMEFDTPIVVGSDAHFMTQVGSHQYADQLLKKLNFPENLILNGNPDELKKYINKYK